MNQEHEFRRYHGNITELRIKIDSTEREKQNLQSVTSPLIDRGAMSF